MFTLEALWIYIAVPVALVFILILIRLKQEKKSAMADNTSLEQENAEETQPSEMESAGKNLVETEEALRNRPQPAKKVKPEGCRNFLGYLYLKKAPDRAHIPNGCYNCPKLLQCLYSPNIIEKVYG